MTWDPTWKALPTHRLTLSVWVNRLKIPYDKVKHVKSIFTSLAYEIASFRFLLVLTNAGGEQWNQGCLWPHRVRFALDPMKKFFTGVDLDTFERTIGPI